MKKNILVIAVLMTLGFNLSLKAQKVQVGVKAGLNFSGVSNFGKNLNLSDELSGANMSLKTKPYVGFHGGLLVRLPVSEKFSVQPEVYYSMQGYASKATVAVSESGFDTTVKVNLNYKLSYIAIPILAQYEVAPGFRLEAGPRIGILTSAKLAAKAGGNSESQDMKEYTNSIDFSGAIGAHYELSSLPLGFYIRYNVGFTDIAKNNDGDTKFKNQVGQAGVFFKFTK